MSADTSAATGRWGSSRNAAENFGVVSGSAGTNPGNEPKGRIRDRSDTGASLGIRASVGSENLMILARHAESMFWMGRYLERVETTARCLECEANSIIHLQPGEALSEWEQIFRSLGLDDTLESVRTLPDRHQVAEFLLSDPDNRGSVVSMVAAVRENLRSVRDRVPIELWEEANELYLRLQALGMSRSVSQELHEMFLMVRQSCLALSGVLNEIMCSDEGHAFISIGRMLERSIFTVGLLKSCLTDPRGTTVDLTRLLRLACSLQAYRRTHGYNPDPDVAMGFLLAAPDLPRSVLSCLVRVEKCLDDLRMSTPSFNRPRRRTGLWRARLEFGAIESELALGPIAVLTELGDELVGIAADVLGCVTPSGVAPVVRSQYLRPGQICSANDNSGRGDVTTATLEAADSDRARMRQGSADTREGSGRRRS